MALEQVAVSSHPLLQPEKGNYLGQEGSSQSPPPPTPPQCQASSSKAIPPKSFQTMPSPTGTECSNAQNHGGHFLFKLLQCNEPGQDWSIAQLMNVCTGPWASHPATRKPGVVAHTLQEELKAKVTFTRIISLSQPQLLKILPQKLKQQKDF